MPARRIGIACRCAQQREGDERPRPRAASDQLIFNGGAFGLRSFALIFAGRDLDANRTHASVAS